MAAAIALKPCFLDAKKFQLENAAKCSAREILRENVHSGPGATAHALSRSPIYRRVLGGVRCASSGRRGRLR